MSSENKTAYELFKNSFHNCTVKKSTLKPGDFYLSTLKDKFLYTIFEEDGKLFYGAIYGSGNKYPCGPKGESLNVYPEIK